MTIEPPTSFHSDVCARLAAAVDEAPSGRRVAVFDYDHTCIHGDIGEQFAQYLVDEMLYRTDLDDFWQQIDPRDGRDEARRLARALRAADPQDPASDELYRAYRAELAAIYPRLMGREGKAVAYAWAVLLHVGITEQQMVDYSAACVRQQWNAALENKRLVTAAGDVVEWDSGIRRFGPIREVHDWLREQGFEVWIVSATNIWTVRTAARLMFGHDPAFAVGNQVVCDDGVLTAELVPPALFRDGKVEVIQREIGVRPTIVFGDSETDQSMMEWASSLAVLIDKGDAEFRAVAEQRDWAIQPQSELTLEGP